MFLGFFENLDYEPSLQSKFLTHGTQTKPNLKIELMASKIQDENAMITILRILYCLNTQLNYQNENAVKFSRTAAEIVNSGFYTGCSDFALVFETMARCKRIPTIHVQTAEKRFIERLQKGDNVNIVGHHFCECYINGKWILVDPINSKILEQYDTMDFNIGHYYVFSKSTDVFETGIHNIDENNKKIIELFSKFNLNQFHSANDKEQKYERI